MRNIRTIFSTFILIFLVFLLTGCQGPVRINVGGGGSKDKGGIFVSLKKGKKWNRMNDIPTTSGKPKSIANYDTRSLSIDPNDHEAVYLGTEENGLYYSYDVADGWNKAKGLGNNGIYAATVSPGSKCVIYASLKNQVHKSTDCSRTWEPIYHDNEQKTRIHTIAVDHYDTSQVYIGTTRGEVIKSSDRGESWRTVERFDSRVEEIEISPFDSRKLFVATRDKGLYRSDNEGEDWTKLEKNMEEFDDRKEYRDLLAPSAEEGALFLGTNYGLLRSWDGGETWERIELLTPEEEATINAIAVNPQDAGEIYYVTDTTFYRSKDGGENWSTRALPTSRAGEDILIDFKKPNIIYLGVDKEE